MDYEKLHKDTIAKLQEMVNSGKITVEIARGICADFAPESEDERIMKSLKILLQHFCNGYRVPGLDFPVSYKDMLAWLEKQGEQNPADTEKGTNGSEREFPIPEPPLTIKHAKEVMGIKQNDAWSEEDAKVLNRISEILVEASEVKNWWKEYRLIEREEMIRLTDFLKSLRPQPQWKPSCEQIEVLESVRKILHADKDIYSKANNLMCNFEELIRTLKKLREK